jgi:hypothetical protein
VRGGYSGSLNLFPVVEAELVSKEDFEDTSSATLEQYIKDVVYCWDKQRHKEQLIIIGLNDRSTLEERERGKE